MQTAAYIDLEDVETERILCDVLGKLPTSNTTNSVFVFSDRVPHEGFNIFRGLIMKKCTIS